MDNPEKLETLGTQDTGRRQRKQINVRENRRGNQEWTILRAHKAQNEDQQSTKTPHNTEKGIFSIGKVDMYFKINQI